MEVLGVWIATIIDEICNNYKLPEDKLERKEYLAKFADEIKVNKTILKIGKEVMELCKKFPIYTDI